MQLNIDTISVLVLVPMVLIIVISYHLSLVAASFLSLAKTILQVMKSLTVWGWRGWGGESGREGGGGLNNL